MEEIVDPLRELARERAERAAAQRARVRLAMLAESSRILAAEGALDRALAGVAIAARRSACDACAIEVTVPALAARVVVADEPEAELRVALERLLDPVQATGMAFVAPDMETQVAEALSPETMKSFRKNGYRSVLVVPLLRRGRLAGMMAWLARAPQRFGAADIVVAEDLAGRIGVAIEGHSRRLALEADVRDRDARLETLGRELRTGLPGLVVDLQALAESGTGDIRDVLRAAGGAARLARRVLDLLDGIDSPVEGVTPALPDPPDTQKAASPS